MSDNADTPVQNQTTKIVVTGMTCGHCVASVTEELKGVDGVLDVRVGELVKGGDTDVFVESDGPLDLPAARAAVEEAGYTASV
ncbi:heavy-metal-associated domain-containing protein [Ornithinimicrobium humiphilum]|uniref:Copper chaperone CopZ n=1 Tax=Ornithinimicrobium humiphilum TaxID=125288 RepID=A0A543KJY2_9MICO|nr:heavy-metal-associated domain-containing protein [Ornithinimicrobium humiphilum]TQM95389.1 copper chaperone CopZ [Ornithinimicrobium humiphilum]